MDTPPGGEPPEILDSYPGTAYLDPRFHWRDLTVTTEVTPHNRPADAAPPPRRKYEQGRVLGGGSAINGQLANRGAPSDYDAWDACGAAGWNWASVLPYFRRLEHDMDFGGELHGDAGPIPVRRIPPEVWNGHAKAVARALDAAGMEFLPDQNGEFRDGYFPLPISNLGERRVSSAIGYLDTATRARKNLTISTDTRVTALMFDGARCIGVEALVGGNKVAFRARETILCSGAIFSPAHLLRAGIGPAMQLRELGIDIVANLPGVGQRLMDHPAISLSSFIKPHARVNQHTRRHGLLGIRFSSGIAEMTPGDMFVFVLSKSAWHAVGKQIASMVMCVNRPFSQTGEIRLTSPEWHVDPLVSFNLLSDRRDLERLCSGFRFLAGLHASPALQAAVSDPHPASYSDRVRKVGKITPRNRMLTAVIAKMLDGPAVLRTTLIHRLISSGFSLEDAMHDDERLEAFVRTSTIGVWHASCTCRMGADDDPMAVTDAAGRVRQVDGLRVCDASIFPVIPAANTNVPVMMVAEKISDAILEGR